MIITERNITFAHAVAGAIWRAEHNWSMDNLTPMYFGFLVPATKIISLGRDYFSDGTSLVVDLYQASFTGGTAAETLNRDLDKRNDAPPLQWYYGVTPGALTDRITGFSVTTQGSVLIGRSGDVQPFVHSALASYVLKISSAVAALKNFSFSVDFRLIQPGEAD